MKRYVFIIIGLSILLNSLLPQQTPVLTFEIHALKAGVNNNMTLCHYDDPGNSGENITWDFSKLQSISDFTGKLSPYTRSKATETSSMANTILDEFNNRFYLNVKTYRIEQTGYSTHNNTVIVTYNKPFVKMIFPFTMGDSYYGELDGSMKTGSFEFPLTGNYEVTADGYGKLLLPGNIAIENALRVKTVKRYEIEANESKQKTEVTVFRWYNNCNRYPLLVLAAIQTSNGSHTSCKYLAAYNNVINMKPAEPESELSPSVRIFPNPAVGHLTLEYNLTASGDAIIDVYSINGLKMTTLLNKQLDAGLYRLRLSPEKEGLAPGHYLIKASLQKTVITEEIIISK